MAKAKGDIKDAKKRRALSPEARENQLIALAYDRAEEQLLAGTASSQMICHFLKMGSEKDRLEKEKLQKENELLRAKAKAIDEASSKDEMYQRTIDAMKKYSGNGDPEDYEDYY